MIASGPRVIRLESSPALFCWSKLIAPLLAPCGRPRPRSAWSTFGTATRVLRAVGQVADRGQTGGVERLDLSGFELLIERAVVEAGLPFVRLDEPLHDDEDGDDRQDDENDGPQIFAHVALDRYTLSKLGQIGEVPIQFLIVQTVTYNEDIRDQQAGVIQPHLDLPARRLIEEHAGPQRSGLALA